MDPRIRDLAEDRTRGASEIAADAADLLEDLAGEGRDAVVDAGVALIRAHPAMAPLLNLVDGVLTGWDDQGPDAAARVREATAGRRRALTGNVADLVEEAMTVATYSRSGTVVTGLEAAARDRGFAVRVSEGRPGQEGLDVARRLADAGIDVTVTTDAALFSDLDGVDLVLVGADAICVEGLVNKVGTGALLAAADAGDVGAIVAAGTDKLLPAAWMRAPPIDAEGRLDVDLPDGVRVEAPLFEVASMEPVTAVVTEEGPAPPALLLDRLEAARLHPDLAGIEVG